MDINGDGMMEWDEFTRFVVAKAQLHHAQMSIDQLAEYRQGPRQVRKLSSGAAGSGGARSRGKPRYLEYRRCGRDGHCGA